MSRRCDVPRLSLRRSITQPRLIGPTACGAGWLDGRNRLRALPSRLRSDGLAFLGNIVPDDTGRQEVRAMWRRDEIEAVVFIAIVVLMVALAQLVAG